MDGFIPIRRGILEHLEQRRMTLMEFGVYVLLQLRADWATGIYRGCALTIAYQFGDPEIRAQVKDILSRLKRKQYINYSPEKGKRGGYEILIHKFEPRLGRLCGTRLNAWKHGEIAIPEYEAVASDALETRKRVARESPEARPIQEVRRKKKEKRKNTLPPGDACERIYQSYPRHVGKSAALRAIPKALSLIQEQKSLSVEESADFLYSQVVKFSNSPAGQQGRYTPHCATWMNSGRYFDDANEWNDVRTTPSNGKPSYEERAAAEMRIARDYASRTGS